MQTCFIHRLLVHRRTIQILLLSNKQVREKDQIILLQSLFILVTTAIGSSEYYYSYLNWPLSCKFYRDWTFNSSSSHYSLITCWPTFRPTPGSKTYLWNWLDFLVCQQIEGGPLKRFCVRTIPSACKRDLNLLYSQSWSSELEKPALMLSSFVTQFW